MIKIVTLILSLSFFSLVAEAQNKRDYYWPFGKDQVSGQEFGAVEIDFSKLPLEVSVRSEGLEFDQNNASICDKEGNLLFYSNGCAVANRLHEVMPNGEDINAGDFFEGPWRGDCGNGYPGRQNITILPDPAYSEGYYITTVPTSTDSVTFESVIDKIQYSYVDMTLDGGLGDVVEKNVVFHDGEILSSYLTSIAHENGRDWWIINPVFPSGYLVYLLDENGISLSSIQGDHVWDDFYSSSSGDARFSPDGTKYALFNRWDNVLIYDFDRSSGQLSNKREVGWREANQGVFTSCEWSPNSRFLYVMQYDSLSQLDTWAEPLEDGLEFIDEWNGAVDPVRMFFQKSALGPDCRIYIRPGSSSFSFHVINKPDEKGMACDFVQQAIRLPYATAVGSFPNFPRFRVDEEDKCDPTITSIFGDNVFWKRDLTAYPNPMTDRLYVDLPEQKRGQLYIMDMQGQVLILKTEVLADNYELDVSDLPARMYSVEFVPDDNKEKVVYMSKVVKVE